MQTPKDLIMFGLLIKGIITNDDFHSIMSHVVLVNPFCIEQRGNDIKL